MRVRLLRQFLIVTTVSLALLPVVRAQSQVEPLVERFAMASDNDRVVMFESRPDDYDRKFVEKLSSRGIDLGRTGDSVGAERYHKAVLWLGERKQSAELQAIAYINLARVFGLRGDLAASQEYSRGAIEMARTVNDEESVQAASANLAIVQRRLGDLDGALQTFTAALQLAYKLKLEGNAARVINNMGLVYQDMGDLARARELFTQSLEMKIRLDDGSENARQDIARSISNIGSLHVDIGDYKQALDHFQRAQEILERSGGGPSLTSIMSNAAQVYVSMGLEAQARQQLQAIMPIAEAQRDRARISNLFYLMGALERAQKHYAEALELQQKSLAIREEIGEPAALVESLNEMAGLALAANRPADALPLATRSSVLASDVRLLSRLWKSQAMTGDALAALGRRDEAAEMYRQSISTIEQLRELTTGGNRERQLYLGSKLGAYYGLARVHVAADRPFDALLAVERGRARALLDVLSGRSPQNSLTDDQRARERVLTQSVRSLASQLDTLLSAPRPDRAHVAALELDLKRARLEREAYTMALYAAKPDLQIARGAAPEITRDDVSRLLTPSTAIVSFVLDNELTWAYVVTGGPGGIKVSAKSLGVSAARMTALANEFSGMVASRNLGFSGPARRLYDLMFVASGLEPLLAGKSQLIVVPDGALWRVPFQALQTPRDTFVLEERAISYAPSIASLAALERRRRARPERQPFLVALGDPAIATASNRGGSPARLPQAAREVRALGKLYGEERSRVLVAEDATEAGLRGALNRASVVHVATHGIIDDVSPMYSHLMLAPASEGNSSADGRLEAWELMNLGLNADLAVLSACETARGPVGDGEGVIGLSWSLFAAGASAAVVSQWEVDSASTTALMIAFHERLLLTPSNGRAVAAPEALRVAAMRLMRGPAYRHPFYWAGFVVIGAS